MSRIQQGWWKGLVPGFVAKMESRLAAGQREYGDASFDRPIAELIDEVEEEIIDQVGWSFIAWSRIVSLREKVGRLERGGD